MLFLKKFFDFYIQSSIHVGLAVFCLAYVTSFENHLCKHITYPCCVLFGTILGYNFLKYFHVFREGKFHSKKYYGIVLVCLLAIIGFFFFFIRMIDFIKIQLFDVGIFVLVYPFLRKNGILKLFWVSFVVAYATAFVFVVKFASSWEMIAIEFAKRFFIVAALLIPFEIYDSQYDEKTLNTIPQRFGIAKAKLIGYVCLMLFLVLDVFSVHFTLPFFLVGCFIAIVTALFIRFSGWNRNRYYTSFWVESVPIIWGLLLFFKNY